MVVREAIAIHAPIDRCFALSTRVELVRETLGMRPIGAVTSGHIEAGSRVIWRGWKFGLPTEHHTLITAFQPPHASSDEGSEAFFQDTQERGRFAFFQHDHHFREEQGADGVVTLLSDEVRFILPFGVAGRFAATLLLTPHVRKLAQQRFARIKALAEGEGWRAFVEA